MENQPKPRKACCTTALLILLLASLGINWGQAMGYIVISPTPVQILAAAQQPDEIGEIIAQLQENNQ